MKEMIFKQIIKDFQIKFDQLFQTSLTKNAPILLDEILLSATKSAVYSQVHPIQKFQDIFARMANYQAASEDSSRAVTIHGLEVKSKTTTTKSLNLIIEFKNSNEKRTA